MLMIMMRHI